MATAEEIYQELLSEHVDEDVIVDTDPCFIINTTTKTVNFSGVKRELAQYDHNSERITFECDRFIEGHDVLLCNVIRVHYTVPGGGGVYDVLDAAALDEDNSLVRFTWLVSSNVTQYAGVISFTISFECVQEDGTITYLWNTKPNTELECVEAIRNSETVAAECVDTLEQMKQQLFEINNDGVTNIVEASQEQQEAIEAKGAEVLAAIPDEYSELSESVNSNTANIEALASTVESRAIHCDATGSLIQASDTGTYPLVNFRLYGKSTQAAVPTPSAPVDIVSVGDSGSVKVFSRGRNLIDASKIATNAAGGATVTNNGDGSFTVSGSGTTTATFSKSYEYTLEEMGIITPGTYTFSTGGVSTTPYMGIQFRKADGSATSMVSNNSALSGNTGGTFTITQDMIDEGYKLKPTFYCPSGATIVEGTFYPMCYKGTEALDFEPFKETTATITSNVPLRGVPVDSGGNYTDADGQQWICDYIDFARGVYIQNCIEVDSSVTAPKAVTNSTNTTRYQFTIEQKVIGQSTKASVCSATATYAWNTLDSVHFYVDNYNLHAFLPITYDIEANPIQFLAALQTPIEISLNEAELAELSNLCTFKPATFVYSSADADIAITYIADTKNYIDGKISTMLANLT